LSFTRFGDYLLNVRAAILSYVIALISIDATAYFSMLLAPSFTSRQEINRSLKLVAFAVAPMLVAGILIFIPVLGFVVIAIGAAYAAYLIYLGLPVILLTPEDKLVPFMITTLVIFAACYIVLAVVAGFIFGVGLVGLFVG
jgi:hypothetical protein